MDRSTALIKVPSGMADVNIPTDSLVEMGFMKEIQVSGVFRGGFVDVYTRTSGSNSICPEAM